MSEDQPLDLERILGQEAAPLVPNSPLSQPLPYTGEHICTAVCNIPPDSGIYDAFTDGKNPTVEDRAIGSAPKE
jgi:hypothetical protein